MQAKTMQLVLYSIIAVLGGICAIGAVWAAKRKDAGSMLTILIGTGGMLLINLAMMAI